MQFILKVFFYVLKSSNRIHKLFIYFYGKIINFNFFIHFAYLLFIIYYLTKLNMYILYIFIKSINFSLILEIPYFKLKDLITCFEKIIMVFEDI